MTEAAADLRRLQGLLSELGQALERERLAISTLDSDLLDAVNRDKVELADQIKELRPRVRRDADSEAPVSHPALRAAVRQAAEDVRLTAQANTILLTDAMSMVGQVLGTSGQTTSYDRHAQTVREPRVRYAKAV